MWNSMKRQLRGELWDLVDWSVDASVCGSIENSIRWPTFEATNVE
jgi:hypothetical protein